jgi:hypothetical protein
MGIGNGAVVVDISLLPHMPPDSGTQHDDNNIYCRHDRVGTFTIGQSTIEKKQFLRHGQRRLDHIDAIFGRRIVSRNKKRIPFDD